MKKFLLFSALFTILGGCGYSSYEECELKEIQKCSNSDCNDLAKSYCDAEFPKKLFYVSSQDTYNFTFVKDLKGDLERINLVLSPNNYQGKAKKYYICLTYERSQKCRHWELDWARPIKIRGKPSGAFYGPIHADRYYPNINGAKKSDEIAILIKQGEMLR